PVTTTALPSSFSNGVLLKVNTTSSGSSSRVWPSAGEELRRTSCAEAGVGARTRAAVVRDASAKTAARAVRCSAVMVFSLGSVHFRDAGARTGALGGWGRRGGPRGPRAVDGA